MTTRKSKKTLQRSAHLLEEMLLAWVQSQLQLQGTLDREILGLLLEHQLSQFKSIVPSAQFARRVKRNVLAKIALLKKEERN